MITELEHQTVDNKATLRMNKDGKCLKVFYQTKACDECCIAVFDTDMLWDMLKDNLATMDVGSSNPGLFRRKREALAATKEGMDMRDNLDITYETLRTLVREYDHTYPKD